MTQFISISSDRVRAAPLGPLGSSISVSFAQRLPYALANLSSAGLLQSLPGLQTQAPRPSRCDPLLPSAWPASHASALIAHAFASGAAAVLPNPRAAADTSAAKRSRFHGVLFAQGRLNAETLGAGMHLWTAEEWRKAVCGERDIDIGLLRDTAVVKHAREGVVSIAIESEEEESPEERAVLAAASPTTTAPAAGISVPAPGAAPTRVPLSSSVLGPRTAAEEQWLAQVPPHLRQSHRVERWFWEVLSEMSPLDKSRFLFFAWGARRLPAGLARDGTHLTVQIINHKTGEDVDNKANDGRLPCAHTCFMIVEMPLYSSKEQLALQLMRALECQGITS